MGESRRENRDGAAIRIRMAAPPPGTKTAAVNDAEPGRLSEQAATFYEDLWSSARAGGVGLLRRLGCSQAEAEEVFADTYTRVMAKVDPVKRGLAEPQMVNLIKVACRRRLLNLRRHEGVLKEVAVPEVEPVDGNDDDEPYERAESSEAIAIGQEAVLSLPPRDRLVFQLRYYQDLSPEEIQRRVPRLSPHGYRKSIQRSNARVLAAYERIESGRRCEELRGATLTGFLAGTLGADLAETVESHLNHCRSCQRRCIEARGHLHEVASTLALTSTIGSVGVGLGGILARPMDAASRASSATGQAARALRERARDLAFRNGGSPGGGGAGAAHAGAISGVKLGIACAGVAAGATCAAAGVIPGIGGLDLGGHRVGGPGSPAIHRVASPSAAAGAEATAGKGSRAAEGGSADKRHPHRKKRRRDTSSPSSRLEPTAPSPASPSEFGAQAGGSAPTAPVEPVEPAPPSAPPSGGDPSGGSSGPQAGSEFGL